MSNAYEAWRETKRRLAGGYPEGTTLTPEAAEYLQQIEETLRPAALTGYLASFRGLDTYEEPLECTPEQAALFLKGLDELRAPTVAQHNAQIVGMRALVRKTLQEMAHLNWTGEHTYGDALDDAFQVLNHVLAGNNSWPVLERFRCPSEYRVNGDHLLNPVRCVLQLPHASSHLYSDAGGNSWRWTDEQSVNPPVPYDAPEPTDEQMDKIADEVFGEQCRSMWNMHRCLGRLGHAGPHEEPSTVPGTAVSWPDEHATGTVCLAASFGEREACVLPEGHRGRHSSGGDAPLTWPNGLPQTNPDPINRPLNSPDRCASLHPGDASLRCVLYVGHANQHKNMTNTWGGS